MTRVAQSIYLYQSSRCHITPVLSLLLVFSLSSMSPASRCSVDVTGTVSSVSHSTSFLEIGCCRKITFYSCFISYSREIINYELAVVPVRTPSLLCWGSSEAISNTQVLFPSLPRQTWAKCGYVDFWLALQPFMFNLRYAHTKSEKEKSHTSLENRFLPVLWHPE